MNKIYTEYGVLKGITSVNFYFSGELEACVLGEMNELNINGYKLVPLYGYVDRRRKEGPAITFYEDGAIKSIALNERTKINTDLGIMEVEKITFYPNGNIKRLFLLDGKLSAYWLEEDEYNLTERYNVNLDFTQFSAKLISMQYYETGKIKSLTLWPKEKVTVKTSIGEIDVRTGVSLYESGKLKSCEPRKITKIPTPIGNIEAYDVNAIGVHGETNSLCFYENGEIKSLITSTNTIKVISEEGVSTTHQPTVAISNVMAVEKYIKPLLIEFEKDIVIIDKDYMYDIKKNRFIIEGIEKNNLVLQCSCHEGAMSIA